jgi:hypothetical protein
MGANARSRAPWLQLPPPGLGPLRSRHVSRGSSSRLLAQGSSGAATCLVAPTPASRLRAAPEPPRVSWLQLPLLGSEQLRSHHVSHEGSTGCEQLKKTNTPSDATIMISIGAHAYLPRRYVTRAALRACKTCSRRRIKY